MDILAAVCRLVVSLCFTKRVTHTDSETGEHKTTEVRDASDATSVACRTA